MIQGDTGRRGSKPGSGRTAAAPLRFSLAVPTAAPKHPLGTRLHHRVPRRSMDLTYDEGAKWAENQETPMRTRSACVRSRLALQMRSRRSSRSSQTEQSKFCRPASHPTGRAHRRDRDRGRINRHQGRQCRPHRRGVPAAGGPKAREVRTTWHLRYPANLSARSLGLARQRCRRSGAIRRAQGTRGIDCSERLR